MFLSCSIVSHVLEGHLTLSDTHSRAHTHTRAHTHSRALSHAQSQSISRADNVSATTSIQPNTCAHTSRLQPTGGGSASSRSARTTSRRVQSPTCVPPDQEAHGTRSSLPRCEQTHTQQDTPNASSRFRGVKFFPDTEDTGTKDKTYPYSVALRGTQHMDTDSANNLPIICRRSTQDLPFYPAPQHNALRNVQSCTSLDLCNEPDESCMGAAKLRMCKSDGAIMKLALWGAHGKQADKSTSFDVHTHTPMNKDKSTAVQLPVAHTHTHAQTSQKSQPVVTRTHTWH